MKTTKKIGLALALTCSLAATLEAQNLYVVSEFANCVGEYGLDGSTINPSLITGLNFATLGIAISGNNIFVVNVGGDSVGEYTTSGETINAWLITGLSDPQAIAISGNDLFCGE